MEWFSFEKECFREPAIRWSLPDFTIMGEVVEGKLICIGRYSQVFKADLEKLTIESLNSPIYPWVHPFSRVSLAQGDVIYWVDREVFELRSINCKTMVKSKRRLIDKL